MNSDIERAKVLSESPDDGEALSQGGEDPDGATPQGCCQQLGLNWMSALDLYEKGMLSFDPREAGPLTRSQQAELKFLGRLVCAGCCQSMLSSLVAPLEKPYTYSLDRMYYNWETQEWRLLEDTEDIEARFDEWVDELSSWGEVNVLERLQGHLKQAIESVQERQSGSGRAEHTVMMRSAGEGL